MIERNLFIAALQLDNEAQRAAYLDQACAGDSKLRERVDALIHAYGQAKSFMQQPAFDQDPTAAAPSVSPPAETTGSQVGPYKLLQRIGEGGMGAVWMAEQLEPIRRKVAVKVIKPGMDTLQVIARFEAERQALSIMDHPNIAKVLDAGATSSGHPYFVMELVKGQPITQYCDENRLTLRQRLELLLPICQAIQHAHQKGIIHRDLKPSNILVAEYDHQPVPKVIDFGVAKAINQPLTERTMFTGYGQIIGTLEYMSPEQAKVNQLDIDTRSDVYSLGVILYELLTGTTPFDKQRLRSAVWDEMLRIIREEEPPRPSARLTNSQDSLPSISARRQIDPLHLTRLVRGDLDWIVMKALEKDRVRRYESASALAAELRSYLDDQPVTACPPSLGYRLRKLARRNRRALAAASLIGGALLLAIGGIGWAIQDRAAQRAAAAREVAERRARVVIQAELILNEMDRGLRDQKWDEARIAAQRAEAGLVVGEIPVEIPQRIREAQRHLDFVERLEGIRLRRAAWIDGQFDVVGAQTEYGQAFRDFFGAELEALSVEQAVAQLEPHHGVRLAVATALDDWAETIRQTVGGSTDAWTRASSLARELDPDPLRNRLRDLWRLPAGAAMRSELAKIAESCDARRDPPSTLEQVAVTLLAAKEFAMAEALLRVAQTAHPHDFWINFHLGSTLNLRGQFEEAARFYTAAIATRSQAVAAYNNLGSALLSQKKFDEAQQFLRKALELDSRHTLARLNLGRVFHGQGNPQAALSSFRQAVEQTPRHYLGHYCVARQLAELGQWEEALGPCQESLKLNSNYANAHHLLGVLRMRRQEWSLAVECWRRTIELEPNHAAAYGNLGLVALRQGRFEEAIRDFRKSIELDPSDSLVHNNLGIALYKSGQLSEAAQAYRQAVESNPRNFQAVSNLCGVLSRLGKRDDALPYLRRFVELVPDNPAALAALAWQLLESNNPQVRDPQQALEFARRAVEIEASPDALNTLSRAAYRCGQWQESLDARLCMAAEGPHSTENLFWLAMTYWRLDKKDDSRKCYAEALEQFRKLPQPAASLAATKLEADALVNAATEPPVAVPRTPAADPT